MANFSMFALVRDGDLLNDNLREPLNTKDGRRGGNRFGPLSPNYHFVLNDLSQEY